jgi:hypothetical protein
MKPKKKRKSLVGWTSKNWYWYGLLRFDRGYGHPRRISFPIIFETPAIWKKLKKKFTKIKITITELTNT